MFSQQWRSITELTAVDTLNVWGAGVIAGGIALCRPGFADTFTTAGTSRLRLPKCGATHTFDANDTANDSPDHYGEQNLGVVKTEDYEVISIATNDAQPVTIAALTLMRRSPWRLSVQMTSPFLARRRCKDLTVGQKVGLVTQLDPTQH